MLLLAKYVNLLIISTQFDGINIKKFIEHIFSPTWRFWKHFILLHKAVFAQSKFFIIFQAKISQISNKIFYKNRR